MNVRTGIDSLVADTLWARLTAFQTRAVTYERLGEPRQREVRPFPTGQSLQRTRLFDPNIQVGDSLIAWTYADGTVFTFRTRKGQEMLVEVRAKPDFPAIADLGKRYAQLAFVDTDPIQPPAGFDWVRIDDTVEYNHNRVANQDQSVNLYVVRDTLRLLGIRAGQCGPAYC